MKKVRWVLAVLAFVACILLAGQTLCPHPEHWLDNFLYATHLKHYESPPDFTSDSFRPTEPEDHTEYEPLRCEVHRIEMRAEVVPIYYGLPGWAIRKDGQTLAPGGEPPREIRERQFPHAEHFALGGCVQTNVSAATARIRICPSCERAEQKWIADYPINK